MSNSVRGSVALQAGDQAYTMSFSINALCELEDIFGMSASKFGKLFEDEDNVSMKHVRNLVMVGLHDHHPEVDAKAAGIIVGNAGLPECMAAIEKAFRLAFPEVKDGENPPKAKASGR